MSPPTAQQQAQAAAAVDSYENRSQIDVDKQTRVSLNGQNYTVFGYKNDPVTGFHATAYRNTDTGDVIIAYRGTDPGLFSGKDKAGHALTTAQDIAVDATMVRDSVNPQIPAADAFTREMVDRARDLGIPRDHVTVAGHSLGGTIGEAEGAKFGLSGTTLNAFGAVGIVPGVPEGGSKMTNYVMAGDVVSAANHHYGQVVPLASPEDVNLAKAGRYVDAPAGSPPPNPFLTMSLSDHGGGHFVGTDSVLNPDKFAQYQKNYTDNKAGFDGYRNEVHRERGQLAEALHQDQMHQGQARLPPDIQRNLNEYLAVNADPAIKKGIEQNAKVMGVEHSLQQGADALRTGGQQVQSLDERIASAARTAGDYTMPLNPAGPLFGAALGEAAHLHGQAAHAAGDFAANQLQSAKHAVEQGAHNLTEGVKGTIHNPAVQGVAVKGVNSIVDVYHSAETAGHNIEQRYEDTKQAVSHGIDATKQAVTQAEHKVVQGAHYAADKTVQGVHYVEDKAVQGAHYVADKTVQGAHYAADKTVQGAHYVENKAVQGAHYVADKTAQGAHYVSDKASQGAHMVSQGIQQVEQDVAKRYDTLTHPGSWFGNSSSTPSHPAQAPTPAHAPTHAPSDPRNPENPKHTQYEKTKELVANAYGKHGMSLSPEQLERTTAGVMLDAQKRHVNDIKAVHLNPDPRTHQVGPNSQVLAFSGNPQDVTTRKSVTDVHQAQQTPPEHSYQQLGQVTQQQTHVNAQAQAQQTQVSSQGQPGMGAR